MDFQKNSVILSLSKDQRPWDCRGWNAAFYRLELLPHRPIQGRL